MYILDTLIAIFNALGGELMTWKRMLEVPLERQIERGHHARKIHGQARALFCQVDGMSDNPSVLKTAMMIMQELVENTSKFSANTKDQTPMFRIDIDDDTGLLRFITSNQVARDGTHSRRLFSVLERLERDGAANAFRDRVYEAGFEPIDAPTGLGILRIAHEGRCAIHVELNRQGRMTVSVQMALPMDKEYAA